MKKLLALLLVGLFCLSFAACSGGKAGKTAAGFVWKTNPHGTVTVTGYEGTDRDVVIPESIAGRKVTEIGAKAFAGSKIKTVKLPDSVESIREEAFRACKSLKEIQFAEASQLHLIGENAYSECVQLEQAMLPHGLVRLDHCAFMNCAGLKAVSLPASLKDWGSYYIFKGCTALTAVSMEEGCSFIGENWFEACTALEEIEIPASVDHFGYLVFKGCTSLKQLRFHGSAPERIREMFDDGRDPSVIIRIYYPKDASGWEEPLLPGCEWIAE